MIDVSFSNPYLSYLFTVQTVFAFLWKDFSLLILFYTLIYEVEREDNDGAIRRHYLAIWAI